MSDQKFYENANVSYKEILRLNEKVSDSRDNENTGIDKGEK